MKYRGIILAIAVTALSLSSTAQTVVSDSFDGLRLRYKVPTPEVVYTGEHYRLLNMDGYTLDAPVGSPLLPVADALVAVPLGAEVEVVVTDAVYDTLPLDVDLMPKQPSRSKSDTSTHTVVRNVKDYVHDTYFSLPLAGVKELGMMRDRRLASVRFAPVQVNHRRHSMVVCRQAEVEVRFLHPDVEATLDHYRRYHSPAYTVGRTLNNLYAKSGATASPVRMVVVASSELECQAIQRFVDWKNRQGIATQLVYTDELGGSDTNTVSAYLQSLYDTASAAWPAPTYVMLVGDHDQLPARQSHLGEYTYSSGWGWWSSTETIDMGDHITDLYHVAWDGDDVLPEAYVGRFSAQDTGTLASIVGKTLLYEQYAFADDAYLGKGILVAGVDGGYPTDMAYRYSDPTMDYAAKFYINAANGFSTVKYYKNRTSNPPSGVTVTGSSQSNSVSATLRGLYSEGYGWINYSAHGDWDQWVSPSFDVTQVPSMNNAGKPSIMIGNCCLSNRFSEQTCFGEALLRRADSAGAVAYVGGTAETYWEQDFWWAVGLRSNISGTMTPTYNAAHMGMYDRLFHTHNEAFADQAFTMGSMIYQGNMSVNSSTPTDELEELLIPYYWEIYTLMGDPSLMPWLGTAGELAAFSVDAEGHIATVANAYVALVDADNHVLGATYADDEGNATLDLSTATAGAFLSVTAQGYKPFFYELETLGVQQVEDADIALWPNPATDRCMVKGAGLQRVDILDPAGRLLSTTACAPGATAADCRLADLPSGLLLVRITTSAGAYTAKLMHR